MRTKIRNVNKVFSLLPIIFGLGFVAIAHPLGFIEQEVYATFYGKSSSENVINIAYPSILSDSKMSKQDNFTASKAHKDNPIQITSQPPTALPTK